MEREDINRVRAILRRWGECGAVIRWQRDIMADAKARREDMYLIYRSPKLDCLPHASVPGNPTERAVVSMEECDELLAETIRHCTEVIMEEQRFENIVNEAVSALPREERSIITHRYRNGMSMIAAAALVDVSERTGYDRETSAIERLSENLQVEKLPTGFREKQ